jgi:hypothetical protein
MVEYIMKIKQMVMESKIVKLEDLVANNYNPNRMPTTEMNLLEDCIKKYGFLFPIIAIFDAENKKYRIIDGYHRYEVLRRINAEEVAIIDMQIPYHEAIQLTILMNRIKGLHKVDKMSDVIVKLEDLGMEDEEILENLGMESEELIRLKQQLGIAHAFRNHEYSKSWNYNDDKSSKLNNEDQNNPNQRETNNDVEGYIDEEDVEDEGNDLEYSTDDENDKDENSSFEE